MLLLLPRDTNTAINKGDTKAGNATELLYEDPQLISERRPMFFRDNRKIFDSRLFSGHWTTATGGTSLSPGAVVPSIRK